MDPRRRQHTAESQARGGRLWPCVDIDRRGTQLARDACATMSNAPSWIAMVSWKSWMMLVVSGSCLACGPTVSDGDGSGAADSSGTAGTAGSDSASGGVTVSGTTSDGSDSATTGTMTTATTAADSTTTGSSEEGGSYLIVPDAGTACGVGSSCDPWAQDCSEGEKCVPWVADGSGDIDGPCLGTRCSSVDPDAVGPGQPCTAVEGPWSGVDDCELGSFCWDVDPATQTGSCSAPCNGNEANPLCPDDDACLIVEHILIACVPSCAALEPDCAGDWVCATGDEGPSYCVPGASLGVATGQATPCNRHVGCGDGFACVAAGDVADCTEPGSCCTAVCDLDAPSCDASVPNCTPLDGAPAGVGVCTI